MSDLSSPEDKLLYGIQGALFTALDDVLRLRKVIATGRRRPREVAVVVGMLMEALGAIDRAIHPEDKRNAAD